MVNGRLKCLGTPQHLKSRFGEGWELDVRLHTPTPAAVDALLQTRLPPSPPAGTGGGMSHADIAQACAALGRAGWEAEVSERGSGSVLWSFLSSSAADAAAPQGPGQPLLQLRLPRPRSSSSGEAGGPTGGGRVPPRMFAEWFLAEESAERLRAFLAQHFGAGVKLIERASWVSFRFSIPAASFASLADLFEVLEGGKGKLGVAEYSAGQAQIEVIFNRLCAQEEAGATGSE